MGTDSQVTEDEKDYNFIQGRVFSNAPPGEEIVISGLSGVYPSSANIYEFQNNLFNKVNMVVPNIRWKYDHPEIPACSGAIPDVEKYDAGFFGVHAEQADAQDAMGRILLEKAVEAVFDAGLSLSDMEGTNTGVYIGACFSETEMSIFKHKMGPSFKQALTGCIRSTLPQRISYYLKLKGPSFISDSACSSSLYALEHAYRDLRMGLVDMALVGGASICFHPFMSMQFARLGVLSLDGSCKVFDASANGYARSEAVAIILLQKSNVAKRNYSEIVHVKTNCDGFKEAGVTYPSGAAQMELVKEFYKETGIPPSDLSYLEAHGTGTIVGDPEEARGIDEVLAKCRNDPLLVGSLKSNIGHAEPASGIASITKSIIALENESIPPNIHFNTPKESIRGIVEGRMKVITEPTPFKDKRGLIGMNSFGFGGANCHVLLRGHKKEKINKGMPVDNIPRIICLSGRTDKSIIAILDELKNSKLDAEYIRLIHNVFRKNISGHYYRGYSIVAKEGEIYRFYERLPEIKRSLYFAFGELREWFRIGKELMAIPIFSTIMQRAQDLLSSKKINVCDDVFGKIENKSKYELLGSILVQMGLVDIFKALEIQPTGNCGISFGKLVAAYFEGKLTFKQTLNCAFILNDDINHVNGSREDIHLRNGYSPNDNDIGNAMEFASIKNNILTNQSNILDIPKFQNGDIDKYKSEYIINTLINNTSSKIDYIEKNSVVLNFGGLSTAEEIPEDVEVLSLVTSKDSSILETFLKLIGNLYVNGYNPKLYKLYPEIKFPVSKGTRMISPFIKWNHDRNWFIPSYDLKDFKSAQHGYRTVRVQLSEPQWSFLKGHVIDGRTLFPATGYLFLVWETLAVIDRLPMNIKHIVFEDCKFLRATTMPKEDNIYFLITINKYSGKFEIIEGDSIVVTGKAICRDDEKAKDLDIFDPLEIPLPMTSKDVYKELRIRGYNYSGDFRRIEKCNSDGSRGLIKWDDNWIAFMDNMLQLKILQNDTRLLYVPTYIAQVTIDATNIIAWINSEYKKKNKDMLLPVSCDKATGEIRLECALYFILSREIKYPIDEKLI